MKFVADEVLHRTAIPLCFIADGEQYRWGRRKR